MNAVSHTAPRSSRREQSRGRRGLPPARRQAKTDEAPRGLWAAVFLSGLCGTGACLGCGLLLCLIASAVLCAGSDPAASVGPVGLGAAAVSCLVGGIVSARRGRRAPLPCGLCCGLLTVLCLATGALCFTDGGGQALTLGLGGDIRAGMYTASVLLCVVGALLGRRRR